MRALAFTYDDAHAVLKQLVSDHGCKKRIDLEVTPSLKRTLGQTQQKRGSRRFLIRLSAYLSYDEMQDTLRHEFAHVMAGLRKGHGESWKEWARAVRATPERCAPAYPALVPLHTYTCPKCTDLVIRKVNRLRLEAGWFCLKCETPLGQFSYAYVEPTEADIPPSTKWWFPEGYVRPLL